MSFWRRNKPTLDHDIQQLHGMSVEGEVGARRVIFTSPVSFEDVHSLIELLRTANAAISLHDRRYPGSESDPGAYFDYSTEKATMDRWSMTLGNHGWTGGIYQIDDITIARQVFNLFNSGLLPNLRFEEGKIFSHYALQSEPKNQEMVHRLRTLHWHQA